MCVCMYTWKVYPFKMCGISCLVALDDGSVLRTRNQLERDLHASLDLIKHRGPDSRGHWISHDDRVGPQAPTAKD